MCHHLEYAPRIQKSSLMHRSGLLAVNVYYPPTASAVSVSSSCISDASLCVSSFKSLLLNYDVDGSLIGRIDIINHAKPFRSDLDVPITLSNKSALLDFCVKNGTSPKNVEINESICFQGCDSFGPLVSLLNWCNCQSTSKYGMMILVGTLLEWIKR